jgi:hypothetical protein
MILVDDKTSYPPHPFLSIFGREISIVAASVDSWKFFLRAVLAPSDWFLVCINDYPMGSSILDELFLLRTVPCSSLGPSTRWAVLLRRER